jgi:chromosome segregation ATPase
MQMKKAADEINQLRIEIASLHAELNEIVQALDVPGVDSVVTKAGAVLHLRTRLRGAEDEAQSLRDRVAKLVKDRTRLRARVKELEEECRKLDADAANEKAERESWWAMAVRSLWK